MIYSSPITYGKFYYIERLFLVDSPCIACASPRFMPQGIQHINHRLKALTQYNAIVLSLMLSEHGI